MAYAALIVLALGILSTVFHILGGPGLFTRLRASRSIHYLAEDGRVYLFQVGTREWSGRGRWRRWYDRTIRAYPSRRGRGQKPADTRDPGARHD